MGEIIVYSASVIKGIKPKIIKYFLKLELCNISRIGTTAKLLEFLF